MNDENQTENQEIPQVENTEAPMESPQQFTEPATVPESPTFPEAPTKKTFNSKALIGVAVVAILGFMLFSENADPSSPTTTDGASSSIFNTAAEDMRLEAYTGSVSLHNNQEEKEVVTGSRLVTLDNLETYEESDAYVLLDKAKVMRLDALTHLEVQQDDKHYDVELFKGSLFFNVTVPLDGDETLEFRTNNIVTGVRGTSGIVSYDADKMVTQITVLSGSVVGTTDSEEKTIEAGQVGIITSLPDGTTEFIILSVEEDPLTMYYNDLFVDSIQSDLGSDASPVALADYVRKPSMIPYQFEEGGVFSEGLAPVKLGGKWGYINKQGTVAVDFLYDFVTPFWEGKAIGATYARQLSGSYGSGSQYNYAVYTLEVLNPDGSTTPIINENTGAPYEYVHADEKNELDILETVFHNGVMTKLYHFTGGNFNEALLIYDDGRATLPPYLSLNNLNDDVMTFSSSSSSGIVNLAGEQLVSLTSPSMSSMGDNKSIQGWAKQGELLLAVNGSWEKGFLSYPDLNWVLEDVYYGSKYYKPLTVNTVFDENDIAVVQQPSQTAAFGGGEWALMDPSGNLLQPYIYEDLEHQSDGLRACKIGGLWGYLDANTHEMAITPAYDLATSFADGIAVVVQGESCFAINKNGDIVAENLNYDSYFYSETNVRGIVTYYARTIFGDQSMLATRDENGLLGYINS